MPRRARWQGRPQTTLPRRRGHLHRAVRPKATTRNYPQRLPLQWRWNPKRVVFLLDFRGFLDFGVFRSSVSWFLACSEDEEVPPPPPPLRYPRAMNATDAYLMSLQRQERELSVNLRGRTARDYARGNVAPLPNSFLGFFPACFSSSGSFLGLQFVPRTDICVSSCSLSRDVGWWLGCWRGERSVVSVEVRGPLRAYRAAAPRCRSVRSTGLLSLRREGSAATGDGGARADLQVLPALDSGDAPGPLHARLPLRALSPQPVRQNTLLDLLRRPPSLIQRQSI